MWGRLGPRFALEAAFLILLAVGLGLADQDWVVIVAVMAGGWALVSLIELMASRRPPWALVERPDVVLPEAPPRAPEPLLAEPPAPPDAAAEPLAEPPVEPVRPAEPLPAVSEDTQEVAVLAATSDEAPKRRGWFRRRKDKPQELVEPPAEERS
jgi:hypothetical protein